MNENIETEVNKWKQIILTYNNKNLLKTKKIIKNFPVHLLNNLDFLKFCILNLDYLNQNNIKLEQFIHKEHLIDILNEGHSIYYIPEKYKEDKELYFKALKYNQYIYKSYNNSFIPTSIEQAKEILLINPLVLDNFPNKIKLDTEVILFAMELNIKSISTYKPSIIRPLFTDFNLAQKNKQHIIWMYKFMHNKLRNDLNLTLQYIASSFSLKHIGTTIKKNEMILEKACCHYSFLDIYIKSLELIDKKYIVNHLSWHPNHILKLKTNFPNYLTKTDIISCINKTAHMYLFLQFSYKALINDPEILYNQLIILKTTNKTLNKNVNQIIIDNNFTEDILTPIKKYLKNAYDIDNIYQIDTDLFFNTSIMVYQKLIIENSTINTIKTTKQHKI